MYIYISTRTSFFRFRMAPSARRASFCGQFVTLCHRHTRLTTRVSPSTYAYLDIYIYIHTSQIIFANLGWRAVRVALAFAASLSHSTTAIRVSPRGLTRVHMYIYISISTYIHLKVPFANLGWRPVRVARAFVASLSHSAYVYIYIYMWLTLNPTNRPTDRKKAR